MASSQMHHLHENEQLAVSAVLVHHEMLGDYWSIELIVGPTRITVFPGDEFNPVSFAAQLTEVTQTLLRQQ